MPISAEIAVKSVQAAVAAIEIYNKPDFSYREEAFSLLMVNAWELLIKAKWLLDHGECEESLQIIDTDKSGKKVPRLNRSGNPRSHELTYLIAKLVEDRDSGLLRGCHDNIMALIEIRDNAAHLLNKDIYLGRRVLEIGTASLKNYLQLVGEWFQIDLSNYNFFLMPLSFYHGFETIEPAMSAYPAQVQKLLDYIDKLEKCDDDSQANGQHVALRIETKFVRAKDPASVPFRWTNDPDAPAVCLREEDILKSYPLTYRSLANTLKRRYSNFLENREYHLRRKNLEKERRFCIERVLNPSNPRSSHQRFYNPNIIQEFDKYYDIKIKVPSSPECSASDTSKAG